MNFKQMYEGYVNLLFPKKELKDKIEETKSTRLEICKTCPFNSSNGSINSLSFCKSCGCNLKAKTACLSCKCPKGKWEELLTDEQEFELKKEIQYGKE